MKRFSAYLAALPLALLLLGGSPLRAQSVPANDSGGRQSRPVSTSPNRGAGSFLTPQTARSQNLAAAEQEDELAVYRHSPSVRAVGRLLHLSPEEAARLFEYLNFAILAGAILFFLLKYLPGKFRAEREQIQGRLAEARTATEQANDRLASIEQRLSRLDAEIASIRARAERESRRDAARIQASIEKEKKRIIEAAEQEIDAAARAAQRDLKRFAGELAVERAARKLTLTEENDRLLVTRFAQELTQKVRDGGRG